LRGAFCQTCGQKDDDYRRPLLTLSNEFLGDVFQWDSRVLRSVVPFLFMPGSLTRAYMRGRRQQFVSPIRLFLVVSIAFFAVLGFSDRALFGFVGPEARNLVEDFPGITAELEGLAPEFLDYVPDERLVGQQIDLALFVDPDATSVAPTIPIESIEETLSGNTGIYNQLLPYMVGFNQAIDDPRVVNEVLHDGVPWLMVVFIPFFAFVMGALYVRRRVWFIDHLVFSLHFHSFLFAVLLLMMGLSVAGLADFRGPGALAFLLGLTGLYLYIAMLRTYRSGIFKTFIKFVILGSVYMNVFFVSLFFYTAYGLSQLN